MTATVERMVRFGAIGVVNTGVHFLVYLLAQTVMAYLLAHVIAFSVAVVVSYFLNCWFTFRVKPSVRGFVLFPLSTIVNLVVSTVGLYVLVEFFGVAAWIAPLPTAVVAIPVTFLAAQFLMLGRRSNVADSPADRAAV